jgi:hypothetical protein
MRLQSSLTNSSRLMLLALGCFRCFGADVCALTDIHGPYGFQLTGTTTISGTETPIAVVGRLVFDDSGGVSGVSSVNFNGLFLGNPTTGSYQFQTDCSMTFSLQDTSGGYQHFSGNAAAGGDRVDIRQSDPGTHERGAMIRSADGCGAGSFRGKYNFTMSGHATPFASEGSQGSGSVRASVEADGAGNLVVVRGSARTSGTYTVDSDCVVQLDFGLADGDNATSIKMRGILVNGGKAMLAIEVDPEQVGSARFSQ